MKKSGVNLFTLLTRFWIKLSVRSYSFQFEMKLKYSSVSVFPYLSRDILNVTSTLFIGRLRGSCLLA